MLCRLICGGVLTLQTVCPVAAEFITETGVRVERADASVPVRFPMFACQDDAGKLFVSESSGLDLYAELQKLTRNCRIVALKDPNRDGFYDQSTVFAENLMFPMGLAWREGKLYVADPPDLVALEDTDGDGKADKRTVILSGFGHSDNGSLHGVRFGPDGWLYMTLGQPDGYSLRTRDGALLTGKSGALIRCRPNGSDVEVVCRGFENLVEIEFLPGGDIIGTDNWFTLPQAGVRDALVHLMEGALYPLQLQDRGTPMLVTGETLPPIARFPAVALSGLVRLRSPGFVSATRGDLLSAQFNTRKVVRHRLKRSGSTFVSGDEDFVSTLDPDFHPSDVLEDKDGSVLIVDTGSWYVHHCPTGRIRKSPAPGGIWRVRRPSQVAAQSETLSREEEIWSFAKLPEAAATAALLPFLSSSHLEEKAIAARVLGRLGASTAAAALVKLLEEPAARLAAAEALAHCAGPAHLPALAAALSMNPDPFLFHALVFALYKRGGTEDYMGLVRDANPTVQRAGLILLNQAPLRAVTIGMIEERLASPDPGLRRTAREILLAHPEWAGAALGVIEKEARGGDPVALSELMAAFITGRSVAAAGARILGDASTPVAQLAVLRAGATLPDQQIPRTWVKTLPTAMRSKSAEIAIAALRLARKISAPELAEAAGELADDSRAYETVRLEALRVTAKDRPALAANRFQFLIGLLTRTNTPEVRLEAADVLGGFTLAETQVRAFLREAGTDPLLAPGLLFELVQHSASPPTLAADLLDCLERRQSSIGQELSKWFKQFPELLERVRSLSGTAGSEALHSTKLASFEALLTGGDPNRGQGLFLTKAGCVACHHVGSQGSGTGPDLTKIGAIRSGRDLLEALLFPSASFAQGYEPYTVFSRAGETLTGTRSRSADDNFTLRQANGITQTFAPGDLLKVERGDVSLMPEGLLEALSRDEARDLLSYLQNLR